MDIFQYSIIFVGSSVSFLETLEIWHYRDMTGRAYDNIPNFQNVSFPLALFFKITVWPFINIFRILFIFTDYFLLKNSWIYDDLF